MTRRVPTTEEQEARAEVRKARKRSTPLAGFKVEYTHGAEDAVSVVHQWVTWGDKPAYTAWHTIADVFNTWTDEAEAADEILALWKFATPPAHADLVAAMKALRS